MLRRVTETEAWCAVCLAMHPRAAFGRASASATGLNYACREAVRRRNKAAHAKNGERRRLRHAELREERRLSPSAKDWALKRMISDASRRAAEKGWLFDLTLGAVQRMASTHCAIFGLEMVYRARGARVDSSASLDRIDSNGVYTLDNVWIVCWRANRLKNNGTAAEHRAIADAIDAKLAGRILDGVIHDARPGAPA